MRDGCPFCDYDGPSPLLMDGDVIVFEPMAPVAPAIGGVPQHLLVVPREHVVGFERPDVVLDVMRTVCLVAGPVSGVNVIASVGRVATQTVPHLHFHLIQRRAGDGLTLPWGKIADEHEPKPQPGSREYAAWARANAEHWKQDPAILGIAASLRACADAAQGDPARIEVSRTALNTWASQLKGEGVVVNKGTSVGVSTLLAARAHAGVPKALAAMREEVWTPGGDPGPERKLWGPESHG